MKAGFTVRQANEIAQSFADFPREEAIQGVLDHIRNFWERPMIDQLLEYVAAHGGAGLHDLVLEAVKRMEVSA